MENTDGSKKLVICFRSSYKDTPFAVHTAGCPDVERTEKRVNDAHLHEIDGGLPAALAYILDEGDSRNGIRQVAREGVPVLQGQGKCLNSNTHG